MARIAVLCYSRSLAHAGRAVAVARELAARGHEVLLGGQPTFLESSLLVDGAELSLEVLFEPSLDKVLAASRGQADDEQAGMFAFAGAITEELALFSRFRPQVVVTDNRRSATISATQLGMPTVSLTNASLVGPLSAIDPTRQELMDIGGPAAGLTPRAMGESPALRGHHNDEVIPISRRDLPPLLGEFIASMGLQPPRYVHELSMGTRTLVLDDPELFPTRDLPAGASQPGPLTFDVHAKLPWWWWKRLSYDEPLIYASFGSTGAAPLFERVVEQLATVDAQLVVATADLIPTVPDKAHACRYLPGSEIARRASLVVCHGGSLTMYQAIASGTPVLAIPSHFEQGVEAIPFVRAGLARVVSQLEVQPGATSVAEAARAMLDEEWTDRIEPVAARLGKVSAVAACAAAAEELL